MGNSYFKFKQFTVHQSKAAMRVNTDGVLLGAWANVTGANRILDIGTGTGVIALMLAQRTTGAHIDAIEIDAQSAAEARSNVNLSPWANRIDVINCSLQSFAPSVSHRYDLIVSNPPYFNQSLKSAHTGRNIARHTESLPYNHLIEGVIKLLSPSGRFCGIFPYSEGNVFIAMAGAHGLYCTQKVNVQSRPSRKVLRVLLQLETQKRAVAESTLTIHNPDGSYSDEYKRLTEDFYLGF